MKQILGFEGGIFSRACKLLPARLAADRNRPSPTAFKVDRKLTA